MWSCTWRPRAATAGGSPTAGCCSRWRTWPCGVALVTLRQESCVTVSAGMDFMAAAGDAEHLIARGEVTRIGKRTSFCRAEISTAEGKVIAAAHSVWAFTGHPLPLDE